MNKILIFLVATASFASYSMATVTITTATGTNGADAYIQLGNASTNYGTATSLTVKYGGNDTSGTNRKVYMRFDVSSLTNAVSAASLSLTVSINNGGSTNTTPQGFDLNLYGLNDGSMAGGTFLGEDWDETLINWDNAPANIAAGDAVNIGAGKDNGGQATLIGSFSVTRTTRPGISSLPLRAPLSWIF